MPKLDYLIRKELRQRNQIVDSLSLEVIGPDRFFEVKCNCIKLVRSYN